MPTDRDPDVVLLTNSGAGSADLEVFEQVQALWLELGLTVRRHVLDGPQDDGPQHDGPQHDGPRGDGEGRLRAAVAGAYRVVVAGGDGTVHHVVSELAGPPGDAPGVTFGIVPLGTGNDLARSLGLPEDPVAAARLAVTGEPRAVDLLHDDRGTVAVNVAHVGVGALAAERGQRAKDVLGPLGYPLGAVLAGVSMTDYPIRVRADGRDLTEPDERLLMVALGNGRTIGGGAPLVPDAELDDGQVRVLLVRSSGPLARAGFARELLAGRHPGREDVDEVTAREVEIEAGGAPLNVDGELMGEAGTRRWQVRRSGWSVVTGPSAAAAADATSASRG